MNHRRRLRSSTCLTAAALLCALPGLALANPQDGVVSAGSASIASSGTTLTVNQTSNKAVIDWRGFDIGAGETTQFVQPNSASIALNRVNSSSASHIDGNLTANGNVIIVNQNGVLFGGGAKVDVNGLVATSADIDNAKFMNSTGALTFDKPGNPNAIIANAGQITAKEAGLVGLVAPNVLNNGIITAKLGRVQLASGDTATVDLYGDGLMEVAVSDAVTSQLVQNNGVIAADGGKILLTAAAGKDIVNSLIDQNGMLQAQTVGVKNGEIIIAAAGSNSAIQFSGTAKASGDTHGNGGKVSIIGKGDVKFTGTIDAMGGTHGGDGGFVETSGHTLSVSGKVNASASHGNVGTWLLDPATINIITGGSTSSLTASSIDPGYLVSSLNGTNITLTADESITVTNAIDASGNASAGNLTLNAPTAFLNAAITLKSGSILSGNASTVNVGASGKVQNGVDVAAANAIVNLSAATYALANQVLIAKSLTLNGNGAILDGQNITRVMEIDGTVSGVNVNLSNLTITNGNGVGANSSGNGGGLLIFTGQGGKQTNVTINNSTIYNNTASSVQGGGILHYATCCSASLSTSILTINNSTIANNSAILGGGISNDGDTNNAVLNINNSTISGNTSTAGGGGLINLQNGSASGTLTIANSIIANNTDNGNESDLANYSTFTSLGYNLFGQNGNAGGFVGNGTTDILLTGNINTVLSALADNGGPTKTMALVSGSAAIGAGGANSGYQLDQRGLARSLSGPISIGAYEYAPAGNPFLITSTVDPSSNTIGTLRTAFNYVNANPFFNPTITFDSYFDIARTITLAQGQLLISGNMTLDGPWAGLTLDAHNASRVMEIDGSTTGVNVTLDRLTMTNGNTNGNGGGLLIQSGYGAQAIVNITNSTISGNTTSGFGGGITNYSSSGFRDAVLSITNSTISNNLASAGAGAVWNFLGTTTINSSTISENSPGTNNGVISNIAGIATIATSIVAGNTVSGNETDNLSFTSLGHNLFGQNGNAGGFTGNGTTDILLTGAINTVLSALADNGGPTKTMALVVGSAAYKAGGAVGAATTDQRGESRGSTISIGAYDYTPVSLVVNSVADTVRNVIGGAVTTLRDALYYSNIGAIVNPTITFDSSVFNTARTINLAQGQLLINSSLTVDGGVYGVTFDAHNASRVMEIDGTSGGITVNLNRLTLENGNSVAINRGGWGGALLAYAESGNHATVNITNSTIANNSANYGGGISNDGVFSGNAIMTISNSTISGNTSVYAGGGIFNSGTGGSATLTISNSTISGNSASVGSLGGGIYNWGIAGGNAALTISDTILAGNTVNGSESDFYNDSGTLTSNGYNLFGQNGNAGGFTGNGTTDILLSGNINTVLSPLADNQGPTKTMALVTGSAAYLAGGANSGGQLDQRGDVRGSTISIGAWDTSYRPASLVVDTTADTIGDAIIGQETHMSLRDALFYANAGALTNPTITFDPTAFATPQTISLAQGQFLINSSLTVDGGVYGVTLDAHNASRVMEIDGTSGGITVGLNRLTLKGGNGVGTNQSGNGGGLLVYAQNGNHATVNIDNSTISGNSLSSGGSGGGIFNDGSNSGEATLTISNSTISVNTVGGGVFAEGGGIFNTGSNSGAAALTINNATLSGNSAVYGGGIFDYGQSGSAILTINNSTLSGNSASANFNGGGGGIFNQSAALIVANTILANNLGNGSEADYSINGGTLTSLGYNLFGQNGNAGGFSGNGTTDILLTGAINTVLSALADNGGPTQTMALKLGSVAIDAGDPSQISALDQRGFTRGSAGVGTGTHADIGAYEAAILNVIADDQEIIYGQAAPSFTYTLASGPTGHLSGSLALITNQTNAGTYAGDIGIGTLAPDNAYLLNFTAGQYKIDARTVTITPIVGQSKIYGSVDPALAYITAAANGSTGLVNGNTLSGTIDYSGADQYANAGSYSYTLGSLSGGSNYTIVMAGSPPTFLINQAPLTVTANAASRDAGAANPTFMATISGFVGSEVLGTSGVTGSPSFVTVADTSSAVGTYAITPSLGSLTASNYSFSTFIDGVLTLDAAPVSVIPNTVLRVSQNPEILWGTIDNFVGATGSAASADSAHNGPDYFPNTTLPAKNRLQRWLDSMRGLLRIDPALAKRLNLSQAQTNEL